MKTQIFLFIFIFLSFNSGSQTFFKTYSAGNNEQGRRFFETDSGFILLNMVPLGLHNSELLRVGPLGDSLWQKYYPTGIFHYGLGPLSKTLDKNFVTAKSVPDTGSNDSIIVYNVDTTGTVSFRFTLTDTMSISLGDIIQTSDSGFLLSGTYEDPASFMDSYVYLIKTDAAGNLEWKRMISHVTFGCPQTTGNLTETSDNHYLLTIYSSFCSMSSPGFYGPVRVDGSGNPVSGFDELAFPPGTGRSLIEKNGDYIYLSKIDSGGTYYTKRRKMDPAGNGVWEKTSHYYQSDYYLLSNSISYGFYMCGIFQSNPDQAIVTRFDDSGDSLYSFFFSGTGKLSPGHFEQLQDGRIAMTGGQLDPFSGNGNPRQAFFLIADSLGNVLNSSVPITAVRDNFRIFPNPFSGEVYLSSFTEGMHVSVMDMRGRIIYTSSPADRHIKLSEMNAGVYIFTVQDGKNVRRMKMVRQ